MPINNNYYYCIEWRERSTEERERASEACARGERAARVEEQREKGAERGDSDAGGGTVTDHNYIDTFRVLLM